MKKLQWIKEQYKGVLEIYPSKCTNSLFFQKKMKELSKDYDFVQVTNDWIRGFKKQY